MAGLNITACVDSGSGFPCLDLSDYIAMLYKYIHKEKKVFKSSCHSATFGMLRYGAPPSMWTVVTSISDPNAHEVCCYEKHRHFKK
jgi:hypothetical protein